MSLLDLTNEEIENRISVFGGLDRLFTELGRYITVNFDESIETRLPTVLNHINSVVSSMRKRYPAGLASGLQLFLKEGALLGHLFNGFHLDQLNQVISIIHESPLLHSKGIFRVDTVYAYNAAIEVLNSELVGQFNQTMMRYFLKNMLDYKGVIRPSSFYYFIESSAQQGFRSNLMLLLQQDGFNITLDGFRDTLQQLKKQDAGLSIEALEAELKAATQSREPNRRYAEKEHKLAQLKERASKRDILFELLLPELLKKTETVEELTQLAACIEENFSMDVSKKHMKDLFNALQQQDFFRPERVRTLSDLLELMTIFSIEDRIKLLKTCQGLINPFSPEFNRLPEVARLVLPQAMMDIKLYEAVIGCFQGHIDIQSIPYEIMYHKILHTSRVNGYHLIKTREKPTADTLDNLDSHIKEAYVRYDQVETTSSQEVIREAHRLFYIDKSLKICHEIPLNRDEIDTFDRIENRSGKLSNIAVRRFAELVQGKSKYYCSDLNPLENETQPDQVHDAINLVIEKIDRFLAVDKSTTDERLPLLAFRAKLPSFANDPSVAYFGKLKEKLVYAYMQKVKQYQVSTAEVEKENCIYYFQFLHVLFNEIDKLTQYLPKAEPAWKKRVRAINETKKRSESSQSMPSSDPSNTITPPPSNVETIPETNHQTVEETPPRSGITYSFGIKCAAASTVMLLSTWLSFKNPNQKTGILLSGALVSAGILFFSGLVPNHKQEKPAPLSPCCT